VLDLLLGEADACIVADAVLAAMSELNPRLKSKLHVLHASEPITRLPLFARKGPRADEVRRLRSIMLKFHTSKKGKQLLLVFKKERLVPVSDADYDSVRRLFRRYNALKKKRARIKGRRPGT
jgi:ABC-type phosphate/phosphonate transport system substrate-binding protein